MQIFSWPVRIYYEDTDAGGVVYHANYLKFFERARTEFLRQLGVSQQDLLVKEVGFVVRHMDIDYIRGATLDAKLRVDTQIINIKKATLVFKQTLIDEQENVICESKVKIACVNITQMKPQAIPFSILTELERVG